MKSFLPRFWKKTGVRPYCSAIIAAAGESARMGGGNKLLLPLGEIPVLAHTLLAIDSSESIDEIIIASREADLMTYADICKAYGIIKPCKVIVGGATRTESVLKAALEANPNARLVAVQDGARPFVAPKLIDLAIRKATACYAVAPAVRVHDTIKVANDNIVQTTPDRATLYAVQTPQVFDIGLLKAALQAVISDNIEVTDDCSAVERLGKEVYLIEGDEENIKITTPLDLLIAQAILEKRRSGG